MWALPPSPRLLVWARSHVQWLFFLLPPSVWIKTYAKRPVRNVKVSGQVMFPLSNFKQKVFCVKYCLSFSVFVCHLLYLSDSMSAFLTVCLSFWQYVCLSNSTSAFLPVRLPICQSLCWSTFLPIFLPSYLLICLLVNLSVSMPVGLQFCQHFCLSAILSDFM